MAKQKLNFRFHNPNTAEATADYIMKIFIDANREKVEKAMRAADNAAAAPTLPSCAEQNSTERSHSV